MENQQLDQHLSQISTAWVMLKRAHTGPPDDNLAARTALLERYQRPAYRYLMGALGDQHAADEVFQDFALRFVRGDFHGADPSRGRFRNYLKRTLSNLIVNFRNQQHARGHHQSLNGLDITAPVEADESKEVYLTIWRKELLDRAWQGLAAMQVPSDLPFYPVLRYQVEHPGVTSSEMAEYFSAQRCPQSPFTDTAIRKTLQRAREKFSELLTYEVMQSLLTPSLDELEEELIELGLMPYCRADLERRRKSTGQ